MMKNTKSYILAMLIGLGVGEMQAEVMHVFSSRLGRHDVNIDIDNYAMTNRQFYDMVSESVGIPLNNLKIAVAGKTLPSNDDLIYPIMEYTDDLSAIEMTSPEERARQRKAAKQAEKLAVEKAELEELKLISLENELIEALS